MHFEFAYSSNGTLGTDAEFPALGWGKKKTLFLTDGYFHHGVRFNWKEKNGSEPFRSPASSASLSLPSSNTSPLRTTVISQDGLLPPVPKMFSDPTILRHVTRMQV